MVFCFYLTVANYYHSERSSQSWNSYKRKYWLTICDISAKYWQPNKVAMHHSFADLEFWGYRLWFGIDEMTQISVVATQHHDCRHPHWAWSWYTYIYTAQMRIRRGEPAPHSKFWGPKIEHFWALSNLPIFVLPGFAWHIISLIFCYFS